MKNSILFLSWKLPFLLPLNLPSRKDILKSYKRKWNFMVLEKGKKINNKIMAEYYKYKNYQVIRSHTST